MDWIVNPSTDPAFNLALEEYLFNLVKAGHPGYAILWQNRPTIVVGRFQNTRQEINADFVREHDIFVVRRMTGGGAVYHDGGTLNYTFIHHLGCNAVLPSFREAGRPIAEALRSLGIPVDFSGRNDLVLEGVKVAGVAHCRDGARFLHHGCLLVDTNLEILAQALHVDPEKFRSRGVASVRSRVTNLADWFSLHYPDDPRLSVDTIRQAIVAGLSGKFFALSEQMLSEVRRLRDSKYASWDWTYGKSPAFTERIRHRFPWGIIEVLFNVQNGKIQSCNIIGDFFMTSSEGETEVWKGNLGDFEQALEGIPYRKEAVASVLENLPLESIFEGCSADDLKMFFLKDLA